jgi:hypothetical protein
VTAVLAHLHVAVQRAIVLVLTALAASCAGRGIDGSAPLPTVRIDGEAGLAPEVEESSASSQKCVVTQEGWSHSRLDLRNADIGVFAQVSSGDATLRLDPHRHSARLMVDLEGWSVGGDVRLDELDVFARQPRWLAGAVRPRAKTPLRVQLSEGRIGLVGAIDISPHHVVGGATAVEVREPVVPCRSIALRPAAYDPTPTRVAGLKLDDLPLWLLPYQRTLDVGPKSGHPLASITFSGSGVMVRELARRGDRCWVELDLASASLLGWADCSVLRTQLSGHGTLRHPARVPRVRLGVELPITIRCSRAIPLFARHEDGRAAHVGSIARGTVLAASQRSSFFVLHTPMGLRAGSGVELTVRRADTQRGCKVTHH